jgi:hypothetical protein
MYCYEACLGAWGGGGKQLSYCILFLLVRSQLEEHMHPNLIIKVLEHNRSPGLILDKTKKKKKKKNNNNNNNNNKREVS